MLRPHSTPVSSLIRAANVLAVRRALGLLLVLLSGLMLAASAADARTRTHRPVADGSVRADQPGASAGTRRAMRVASDPRGVAYLRFRVSGVGRRVVRRALLRVYVSDGDRAGLELRRASRRSWSERSLTYRTRPRVGPVLSTSADPGGRWVTFNATAAVRRDGTVPLAVGPPEATSSTLAAREDRGRAPQLIVRTESEVQPAFPLRTAFYDARDPYAIAGNRHHPRPRPYGAGRRSTFRRQLAALDYGNFETAVIPWDAATPGSDVPVRNALAATRAAGGRFRWAAMLNLEAFGDPSSAEIAAALAELDGKFTRDRAYLRTRRRPVVFVTTGAEDSCAAAARWKRGNVIGAHLVMDTVRGYTRCGAKPGDWIPYEPDRSTARTGRTAYSISAGYFPVTSTRAVVRRDFSRWAARVRLLRRARARWQLVHSFNNTADGSSIENATEWLSPTGYGWYLDILRAGGAVPKEKNNQLISAVGDIVCDPSNQHFNNGQGVGDKCRHAAVYDLMKNRPLDAFLPLGDLQYETGQYGAWAAGYDRTFGNLRSITRPVTGNHEYLARPMDGKGYFDYWNGPDEFSGRGGDRDKGYYSFNLGKWHLVALNTNCSKVGGCGFGSRQERWLRADLAANPTACSIFYAHHPRFSAGGEGPTTRHNALLRAFREYGGDIVLAGHDHDYERFRMQTETGAADPNGGMRHFVIGTGGKNLIPFVKNEIGSVVRDDKSYGTAEFTLKNRSYSWEFKPIAGHRFRDSGSANCH